MIVARIGVPSGRHAEPRSQCLAHARCDDYRPRTGRCIATGGAGSGRERLLTLERWLRRPGMVGGGRWAWRRGRRGCSRRARRGEGGGVRSAAAVESAARGGARPRPDGRAARNRTGGHPHARRGRRAPCPGASGALLGNLRDVGRRASATPWGLRDADGRLGSARQAIWRASRSPVSHPRPYERTTAISRMDRTGLAHGPSVPNQALLDDVEYLRGADVRGE